MGATYFDGTIKCNACKSTTPLQVLWCEHLSVIYWCSECGANRSDDDTREPTAPLWLVMTDEKLAELRLRAKAPV